MKEYQSFKDKLFNFYVKDTLLLKEKGGNFDFLRQSYLSSLLSSPFFLGLFFYSWEKGEETFIPQYSKWINETEREANHKFIERIDSVFYADLQENPFSVLHDTKFLLFPITFNDQNSFLGFKLDIAVLEDQECLSVFQLYVEIFINTLNIQERTSSSKFKETNPIFMSVLNEIDDAILILDQNLNLKFYNSTYKSWCDLTGKEITNLVDCSFSNHFPFFSKEELDDYKQIFSSRTMISRYLSLDIKNRIFLKIIKIPLSHNGEVEQVLTIIKNITEQKKYERVIDQQKKFYENIILSMPIGVFSIDLVDDGQYSLWNPKMEEITGYYSEAILGRKDSDLCKDSNWFCFSEKIKSGESEIYAIKKGTRQRIIQINRKIFYDNEGLKDSIIGLVVDISDNVKAQRKIKQINTELQRVNNTIPDIIWSLQINKKGDILKRTYSKAIEMLFGYTPEDLNTEAILWEDLIYEKDKKNITSRIASLLKGTKPTSLILKYRIIDKWKNIRWVRDKICLTRVKENLFFLDGVISDITKEVSLEQSLKQYRNHLEEKVKERTLTLENSTARIKALIESSRDIMVYSLDSKGLFVFFNSYYKKLVFQGSGIKLKIGDSYKKIFYQRSFNDEGLISIEKAMNGQSFSNTQVVKIHGRRHVFQNYYNPIKTNNKNSIGLTVFSIDITKRIVKEQESLIFKSISENAHYGTLIVNQEGKIIYVNRYQAESHGYKVKEVLNKDIHIFYNPNDYKALEILQQRILSRGHVSSTELNNQYRNGFSFPMLTTGLLIKNKKDRPHLMALMTIDLSRQKDIEEKLKKTAAQAKEATRAKSEFLANMSHELRTPLNAIIGFSDLLMFQSLDAKMKSYTEAIQKSSKNLHLLIDDILDLSKIEAGKLLCNIEPVNLREIALDIEKIFELKAKEKKLNYTVNVSEDVPLHILSDQTRIRQILLNLTGNAFKFTKKGNVTISMSYYPEKDQSENEEIGEIRIEVSDTGIGIPFDQQDKIFEAFVQQQGQSTREYGGTGLGLAITTRLVKMLNGKILLESTPGEGSIFKIILEKVKGYNGNDSKFEEETYQPVRYNNQKVLIVDDNHYNCLLTREYLEYTNLQVFEATNGKEAIHVFKNKKPDLIIMDIRMPVMNGETALFEIRKMEEGKVLPIIAFTASVLKEKIIELKKEGFNDVILKPSSKGQLHNVISRFLSHTVLELPENDSLVIKKYQETTLDSKDRLIIKEYLETKIFPLLEKAQKSYYNTDIESFAFSVKKLGIEYNLAELVEFSEKLVEELELFDIEAIMKSLNAFPVIINKSF